MPRDHTPCTRSPPQFAHGFQALSKVAAPGSRTVDAQLRDTCGQWLAAETCEATATVRRELGLTATRRYEVLAQPC